MRNTTVMYSKLEQGVHRHLDNISFLDKNFFLDWPVAKPGHIDKEEDEILKESTWLGLQQAENESEDQEDEG